MLVANCEWGRSFPISIVQRARVFCTSVSYTHFFPEAAVGDSKDDRAATQVKTFILVPILQPSGALRLYP
jgi:hypothetical protein